MAIAECVNDETAQKKERAFFPASCTSSLPSEDFFVPHFSPKHFLPYVISSMEKRLPLTLATFRPKNQNIDSVANLFP